MREKFDNFLSNHEYGISIDNLLHDFLEVNRRASFNMGGYYKPDALCEIWNNHPDNLPKKTIDDFKEEK